MVTGKDQNMKSMQSGEMFIMRDEEQFEINIEGYVVYSVDTKFGEDADGNRGSKKIMVEGFEDLMVHDEDGDDVDLDEGETQQAIADLTQKFLKG